MSNYPNEKKDRNKKIFAQTVMGIPMLERIIEHHVSAVRIGVVLKREFLKVIRNIDSDVSISDIAIEYGVTPEKLQEYIKKEAEKEKEKFLRQQSISR